MKKIKENGTVTFKKMSSYSDWMSGVLSTAFIHGVKGERTDLVVLGIKQKHSTKDE